MKKFRFFLCILCLALMLCSLSACGDDPADSPEDTDPAVDDTEVKDEVPEVKEFPLIEDGKCLYRIVRPEDGTLFTNAAAAIIHTHLLENKVRSELKGDWNKQEIGSDICEILVGNTAYNPEINLPFELTDLGSKGFVIKNVGNKILLLAGNESGLTEAAEYFVRNFLDISGGKTTMPENYEYISSNGKLLTSLTLGGKNISEYSVVSEGFDASAAYLKSLIAEKTAVSLTESGSAKIILTSKGATAGMISAKFENGDLVLRAPDEASMKKAVFAFWFDNIGHQISAYDLPADINYSLDLSKAVFYSDHGVAQSETECCMDALIAAHDFANERGFKVYADLGAKYYISSTGKTVQIRTDVEWGNAEFTIDDSKVPTDKRGNWIFNISSTLSAYEASGISSIDRNSSNIGITLPQKSIITVYDADTIHYVRHGGNANNGQRKQDSVIVDTDGSIDMSAPFMWDFDKVTSITVRPIDTQTLTVSGGIFTTVANQAPSEYTYYNRGISINRSNTTINDITHYIVGEGDHGAPYNGFFSISNCAYINIENCLLSGHKRYKSPTTFMGTYDIGAGNALSVTFRNCSQTNDISDGAYWGIMGTNYIKNITYDGCVLSRFDAHKGVTNATIKNSVIGHGGASVVGYGSLTLENSKFYSKQIIDLRSDYGSTWDGEVVIRNCEFTPINNGNVFLIMTTNPENHNFGYTCYAPKNIEIDGLHVNSSSTVYVMSDPNKEHSTADFAAEYPYIPSEKVTVKGYTANSSKAILLNPNTIIFRDTEFTVQ